MGKITKRLSMVFIMAVLVVSFSVPFMLFPSKVYGGAITEVSVANDAAATVVNGGTLQMAVSYGGTPMSPVEATWSVATLAGGTASIDANGLLTATGAGTVTVTAIVSSSTGIKVITITEASAPSRPLTPEEIVALNLSIGQQVDRYGATSNGFVEMLYDNALGRVYDGGGFGFWTGELAANTMTGSQVAFHFIFSDELAPTINNLSDNDFIAFLYQTLMNRPYDLEGYANWQQHMEAGMTREETVNYFVNSAEFAGICTLFNVTP